MEQWNRETVEVEQRYSGPVEQRDSGSGGEIQWGKRTEKVMKQRAREAEEQRDSAVGNDSAAVGQRYSGAVEHRYRTDR